jgi:light-regulated signal transduction histidine kinase (bacteriophytochrome)
MAGTVYIQSDFQELIDRLKRYLVIVGIVCLASLVAAVLMSSVIRRAIADPILQLAETARIVSSEKRYSIRAPVTRNRDELSSLIGTFNEMLEQIQERDTALREAHDSMEQRVQERTEQLDAANKELEAFSYSVSHDLRAPLRHIGGFSRILSEEYGSQMPPGALHYLERIQGGARNMGQLVDDLLKLAQIGRKALAFVPTDLNSLLKGVVTDLQPEHEGRQIDWQIGELPSVECDPGLIRQVFTNLLSNAVKYTRRREIAVIKVGEVVLEGGPTIFIRDNGVGFNEQYANKLFGVFQRLHPAEEFEGTGVGLATVQRIVKKHGGSIWAKSEVDKGATFFFALAAKERGLASAKKAAAAGRES